MYVAETSVSALGRLFRLSYPCDSAIGVIANICLYGRRDSDIVLFGEGIVVWEL